MTAPALPRSGSRTNASVGVLETRLGEARSGLAARFQSAQALFGIAPLIVGMAVLAALLGDGRWMTWPRAMPMLIWSLIALGAYAVFRWHSRFFPEVRSIASLAGIIEREQSLRDGSLRGALEVGNTGTLGAYAAAEAARRLSATSLAPQLDARLRRVQWWGVAAAVLSIALLMGLGRVFPDGLSAAMHPIRAWRGTLLPALGFDKLPTSVPRGMPLTVRVHAEGRHVVIVSRRAAGEAWRDTTLDVDATTGLASLALGPVRAPVTLRVNDGRAPEAMAIVAVDERGWIGDVSLFAEYPGYLARANETLEPVSPVSVPRGTRVRVSAVLRGGARDATLSDGATSVALVGSGTADAVDGEKVSGVLVLDHDGAWKWAASATPRTVGGTLPPELPDSLWFVVMQDKPPEVIIDAPTTDTAIGSAGVVPVFLRAGDDHGVSSVALTIWREAATADEPTQRAAPRERIEIGNPAAPFFEGGVTVSLDGRGLEPGDRLHLVAIATDDSPWRQQTSSTEVILRVPTLAEQRSMARSLADSLAARAQQMAQQEKRLQQNTVDAAQSRDLKNGGRGEEQQGGAKSDSKGAMSFQQAEKARELARQQQQMGAKIDSLRQSTKELENRLKSANALDTALANRMRDIQQLLRDAMTPEMQKQLEALNKSTDRLSGAEAQASMEQLAQQQQQMRQQLEKSAEMLKRAALEGSMSTLRDDARELADAQKKLANELEKQNGARQPKTGEEDPRELAERSRALQEEVDKLAKRLEQAGAKPGASKTRAAQPMVDQAAEAMDRAAREALKEANAQQQQNEAEKTPEQTAAEKAAKAIAQALADKDKNPPGQQQQKEPDDKMAAGAAAQSGNGTDRKPGAQSQGAQGQQGGSQQQGGQQGKPQPGQQGQPQPGQQGQAGQGAANDARQAGDAMDQAAQQLSAAREAQVDAWKTELSQQLDQSINETMQLARQQSDLEQRARQGGNAQSMQGEQGAVQQGVQQAAERLEQAGRSSSLLSQRSQKAMADAQRRVEQATQQMGQAGQPGGNEQVQNAMKDASEALNQALSSLVRDREKVNNAQSASGFSEMMEQLKQLAQQQGALNGQMQGLNLLPGGAQGDAAKAQARVLARQQREVAKTLSDVSDADQTGRTDALAKEAQTLAQQIERSGLDPSVAARQQQLYRRLLDAGRFLEQDERDDQGPREAKTGNAAGARIAVDGPQSGRAANKFEPPTWNELRGLGPEERRLVIEYFRRLNGKSP